MASDIEGTSQQNLLPKSLDEKLMGLEGVKVETQINLPFVKGRRTSFEAAQSIGSSLQRLEREILYFIELRRDRGATCDELEWCLGFSHQTSSARLRGLFLKGKIKDSSRRRKTRSGRGAIVWVAID